MQQGIVLRDITKSYDGRVVLDHFSLDIPYGRTTALMAPSGWGKTTLLRILMGLAKPDGGTIEGLLGLTISAVFQEDRLCENMTALANIQLVARGEERAGLIAKMEQIGLSDCFDRRAGELSGGMKRRVAILRALCARYELLLLDEPFLGLDEETKTGVLAMVKRESAGKTVVLVTHDEEEARRLGAEIVKPMQPWT